MTKAPTTSDVSHCTCCEKKLGKTADWLELDQRTDTYTDSGDVPEEHSQGWFPFGPTCARKLRKAHQEARQ